jgi:hypothetical protein
MREPDVFSPEWFVQMTREGGHSERLSELNTTLEVLLMYQEEIRSMYDAAPRQDLQDLLDRTTRRIQKVAEVLDNTVEALDKHLNQGQAGKEA